MRSRWIPVFQGTIPEVITLQSSCEASGIPTYVPDMNLIQADPFLRGGNALALVLHVPEDRIDDARSLVPERLRPRGVQELTARERAERLGRRVRWCIVLLITWPVGLWLGARYLHLTRSLDPKPAEHHLTVASFWVCLLLTLAMLLVWLRPA